jgi:predicted GIY-YIG superfamily endonuclease
MPYVYMLECADGSFYVGSTRCLDACVGTCGGPGSEVHAKPLPVQLVWAEEMDRIDDAYYLEKQARLNQRWTFIGRRLAQLAVSVVAAVQMLGQRRFSTSLSRPGSVPRFVLLGRGTVK